METNFIVDNKLRKRVEDSVEYISFLYITAENHKSNTYKSETNRVIVLYCVAIMEALMFLIYEKQDKKIQKLEYKESTIIPEKFNHKDYKNGKVVIAVRCGKEKTEPEIGLVELLDFLKDCKILKEETVTRIKDINQQRNTFHLRKNNLPDCSKEDVEEALSLLFLTIEHTPRFIKKGN